MMIKKLIDAIYQEDPVKVASVLAKGVNPDEAYEQLLPLVEACQRSTAAVVDVLLKAGASVNQHDSRFKHSPLTAACKAANLETVRLLIEHGADVNYCRNNVATPLSDAASGKEFQRVGIARVLLDAGADPKAVFRSKEGVVTSNVLMVASQLGTPEMVALLIKAGAPVNDCLFFGTPLIVAVEEGRDDIVRVLLTSGADPLIRAPSSPKLLDVSGKNALELAIHTKKKKIVVLLREARA